MEAIEYILGVLVVASTFFPFGYIFYKRIKNKSLFVASIIGFYFLIEALLMTLFFPAGIFMVKVVPQLAEQGQVIYIIPLLYIFDFIQEWWFVLLHPVLSVALPMAVYRRYSLFHPEKGNVNESDIRV